MKEDDGDKKSVEEEGEEKADEDDNVNIWLLGLHEVHPRKLAVCVICQRGVSVVWAITGWPKCDIG